MISCMFLLFASVFIKYIVYSGNEWMAKSRMFMGIDVSHAAPQSLFDREKGVPCNEPTVVGVYHV